MTVLFQGNRTFPAGQSESALFPVPAQMQVPGLTVQITMASSSFPVGTTNIDILLSPDNGSTFQGNPFSFTSPDDISSIHGSTIPFRFGFAFGAITPNSVKFVVNAPAQFTTAVLVETL